MVVEFAHTEVVLRVTDRDPRINLINVRLDDLKDLASIVLRGFPKMPVIHRLKIEIYILSNLSKFVVRYLLVPDTSGIGFGFQRKASNFLRDPVNGYEVDNILNDIHEVDLRSNVGERLEFN